MVDICCDEHQLLNSQLQLCPVILAIKKVNQTLLTTEVYNVFAIFFLSLYFLMYWNKMESGMLGGNVVPMKESNNVGLSSFLLSKHN